VLIGIFEDYIVKEKCGTAARDTCFLAGGRFTSDLCDDCNWIKERQEE
jgi:hypothetical protein